MIFRVPAPHPGDRQTDGQNGDRP